MSMMLLFMIVMMITVFGSLVLAGVAIWALATKKETLPQWGKIVLWLFVVLGAVLLITGIISVFAFLGKFIMW